MGHTICALVVAVAGSTTPTASTGPANATLVTRSTCRPGTFPFEVVLADLVREVTGVAEPLWAIIQTDYFGGYGHDTIGLGGYRHNPEYLDRYADLA